MQILIAIILLLSPSPLLAAHVHPEKFYQNQWCNDHGGQQEVVLDDGTRIDCLTDTHAIEFDFAPKWAESVGQSLHYALKTGKKPGIVLIMENPKDIRHLRKLQTLSEKYNFTVWTTSP